ncbi:MAG: hypothetical protein Q9227_008382 [Pyrenula ochraceoflavens]
MEPSEEKSDAEDRPQLPEAAHVRSASHEPISNFNISAHDLESQKPLPDTTNQSQSILAGQNYGRSPQDEPTQPARRTTSRASLRSTAYSHHAPTNNEDPDGDSVEEDLVWGPAHPCFPHLNPHVPLNSAEYVDTRIIRIRRDWMVKGDLAPTFSNLYPEILDPLMPEQEFRTIIQRVNSTLIEAFNPFSARSWVDGILGLLTGWLWEDLGGSALAVKKKLRALEQWIEQWNQDVGSHEGVKVVPLRRTGYTCLDVQIPDPKVRVVTPPGTRDGSQRKSWERKMENGVHAAQGKKLSF